RQARPEVPSSAAPPRHPFAGFAELLREQRLRNALLTSAVNSLFCAPIVTICAVLVRDALHEGASRFGGALSAFGVGGVVGSLALLALEGSVERQRLSSGLALLFALTVIAASQATSLTM